jgi:hypothetical protein
LAEAPSHGKAIMDYDPYSAATAAYEVFAQEVLERLEAPVKAPAAEEQEPPPEPIAPASA